MQGLTSRSTTMSGRPESRTGSTADSAARECRAATATTSGSRVTSSESRPGPVSAFHQKPMSRRPSPSATIWLDVVIG
nr:hypothetical protein [Nonomuraea sp. WAC 01424]